ncbi:probable folate-biopterin transporter 6 [Dendrobium catenatum]|uniref:Putative folate-biopterin transporter 6 n=1 Tax=Dendrobium catenatum TaxID=906689 RepID=A0A2I0WSY7_9ASPA|nr:probable folate-biopterin transporter 6 [Dendrobium catenatum]PKU78761.1 putative folate-biopterin transporter 6 [Dendrobium catenatum]
MKNSSESQDLLHRPPPETTTLPAGALSFLLQPLEWIRMLCRELNTSFVLGVMLVYGLSQGFTGSFFRVVTDFYWKDVQKVQPSAVQMYIGFYYIPWILKPVWGILTDMFPVRGYRRRPYFILAGVLGASTALTISMEGKLSIPVALLCLVGMAAGVAIADVTIDACIAKNSIEKPNLAPDLQSLCSFVSSVGALIGYSSSGILVHLFGSQGALGLMAIPPVFLVLLGFAIFERKTNHPRENRAVGEKVREAVFGMGRTIRCPEVWKPSLFMFLSIALSLSTHEGQFYWYTDPKAGPAFSQGFVGIIYAIGAIASIIGVLIYHKLLKNHPFRSLIFYSQLLYSASGMLDLIFILRWNLKLGIPDYIFVILEECVSRVISRIRWMPMIVLSTRLCPAGIEGTFFALLMCIDSLGSLGSKTGGGVLLNLFHVTRTDFRNLWLVVFIRNLLRLVTVALVFLVPYTTQLDALLPSKLLNGNNGSDVESLKLVSMKQVEVDETL